MTCFQSLKGDAGDWESPQHHRVEVPVFLKRMPAFEEVNLKTLTDLPKILVQEENEAYQTANQSTSSHILTRIHNASAYAQTLCNVTETITSPLIHLLHATNSDREIVLGRVVAENRELADKISLMKERIESDKAKNTLVTTVVAK